MADMRDFLARRKAKVEAPAAPEAPKAPPAAPAAPKKGPKKAPAAPACACGQPLPAGPCPSCRRARNARKREKRDARKAAARAAAPPKGRLPDGAVFNLRYDGEAQAWSGALCVPGAPDFAARESGVVKALFALDGLYREWVKAQEGHADAAP
jgi:hypothetical protein